MTTGIVRAQRGDTIVEVMLALAVSMAVLASSYAVVNRTMNNNRQAQEHAEALHVANEQIERIVTYAAAGSEELFNTTRRYHCVSRVDGSLVPLTRFTSPPFASMSQAQVNYYYDDPTTATLADCAGVSTAGYRTVIEYVPSPAPAHFKVYVSWASVSGNDRDDRVIVTYRPYSR